MPARSAVKTAGSIGASPLRSWGDEYAHSTLGRRLLRRPRIRDGASAFGCSTRRVHEVHGGIPGTVLDEHLSIACAKDIAATAAAACRPCRGQVSAFLRGHPIAAGTVLPCPATS